MRSMEPTEVPPYFWTINTAESYTAGGSWYSAGVSDVSAIVVLSTFPDAAKAAEIARVLIDERLAACVNLVPTVRSIYRWQGALQDDAESLAIIKTTADRHAALAARLVELHPYEVPEIIALPVAAGHAPYLAWLAGEVDQSPGQPASAP
jgi:periplasmic divalent cation tolerance protein